MRVDTFVAVGLGGLVSMAIVVTAAFGQSLEVKNAADRQLVLNP